MAESLVLHGLTCNIFQLIEHGYRVLAFGKYVYAFRLESSQIAQDIRLLLEDIKNTTAEIQSQNFSNPALSPDEKAIASYGKECNDVAAKLLGFLDGVQPRSKNASASSQRLQRLRTAGKMAVKKSEIMSLQRRLRDLDDRLRARLLRVFQARGHSAVMAAIGDLQGRTQDIKTGLSKVLQSLEDSIVAKLGDVECELSDLQTSLDTFMKGKQKADDAYRVL